MDWIIRSYLQSLPSFVRADASRASAAHNLEVDEVDVDGVGLKMMLAC